MQVLTSLTLAGLISLGAQQCSSAPAPRPDDRPTCGEYTPGRVLIGEYQDLSDAGGCEISPPTKLDLLMDPNPQRDPRTRCDNSGGTFHKHRDGTLRCNGVDY